MIDYMIKLVWPDWWTDPLRDVRVGFSKTYRNLSLAKGCRMLVYMIEHQRAMGVYTVSGTFKDGEMYDATPGYPHNVPLKADFVGRLGISLQDIRSIVPEFQPAKDMSFFQLDEKQFASLEALIRRRG